MSGSMVRVGERWIHEPFALIGGHVVENEVENLCDFVEAEIVVIEVVKGWVEK